MTLALACCVSLTIVLQPFVAQAEPLSLAQQLADMGQHQACAVEALRDLHGQTAAPRPALTLATHCLLQAHEDGPALRLLNDGRYRDVVAKSPELIMRSCVLQAIVQPGLEPSPWCQVRPARPEDSAVGHDGLSDLQLLDIQRKLLSIDANSPQRPPLPSLANQGDAWQRQTALWLARSNDLPAYSPALAGALSALLPGLGRVYQGRWQDGAATLGVLVVPAYFAETGFAQAGLHSTRGWVLGAVTAVLYAGNVYGSWLGAVLQNQQQQQRLHAEIRQGMRDHAAQ